MEKKSETHKQATAPDKLIGTWVRNSETNKKNAFIWRSLDEVIENRRIQFKLIAIKSGTDSNLLNVTSHAAGLLSMCSKCLVSARTHTHTHVRYLSFSLTARICQNNDWASCLPTIFFIWFLFVCLFVLLFFVCFVSFWRLIALMDKWAAEHCVLKLFI